MAFQKGQVNNPNGRPKGARNKVHLVVEKLTEEAIKGGILPLDYFLALLRNEDMPISTRFEAGKAAAPYVHRKMPIAVEVTNENFKVLDMAQLQGLSSHELEVLEGIMAKAADASRQQNDSRTLQGSAQRVKRELPYTPTPPPPRAALPAPEPHAPGTIAAPAAHAPPAPEPVRVVQAPARPNGPRPVKRVAPWDAK